MEFSKRAYNLIRIPFIRFCVRKRIAPNQITIFNMLLVLVCVCYLLSRGSYVHNLWALGFMAISSIIDYSDGDLAKQTNAVSQAGIWIDTYSDIILQNAVMGAVSIGAYKQELPLIFIVLFFVFNSTLNLVSLQYNDRFEFSSYKGNELFRQFMDQKPTLVNRFFKSLVDPTYSRVALVCYSVRYWLIAGIISNQINIAFIVITLLTIFRSALMYFIYTFYLLGSKKLWLLQALSLLDDERKEFYAVRQNSQ